jgi:hypothetical protein
MNSIVAILPTSPAEAGVHLSASSTKEPSVSHCYRWKIPSDGKVGPGFRLAFAGKESCKICRLTHFFTGSEEAPMGPPFARPEDKLRAVSKGAYATAPPLGLPCREHTMNLYYGS